MSQPGHLKILKRISSEASQQAFVIERALGAYLASVTRPDLSFGFSVCSQFQSPTPKSVQLLNDTIEQGHKHPSRCLKFVMLSYSSCYVAVYSEASFAGNPDLSSQIGFVNRLAGNTGSANIIHHGSVKSKRVARSALAAELIALVHACDQADTICVSLNSILSGKVPLDLLTNSKSIYEYMVRVNHTGEKRLLIGLAMLRQVYERRKISQVMWIPAHQNPPDALTKAKPNNSLNELIDNNRIKRTHR